MRVTLRLVEVVVLVASWAAIAVGTGLIYLPAGLIVAGAIGLGLLIVNVGGKS